MKGNREPFRSFLFVIGLITAVTSTHLAASHWVDEPSLTIFSTDPWYDEGTEHGADYGYAVNAAGDVNNDGFDDIIVGVPKYSTDEYKGGAVFAYYGTASGLPNNPDWQLGGDQQGSRFGAAVSSAGDVNGDGFDDIIIGAPEFNVTANQEGRVYIVYGSASGLSESAAWVIDGQQAGENLGFAVACAGHVNDDQYADIIIGARRHQLNENMVGAAFVFYGQNGGLSQTSADWTVTGEQIGASFGSSVNSAGDINHDGFDDIIIGAPNFDNTDSNTGAAYLFLGGASGLNPTATYAWKVEGTGEGSSFGTSVSSAGDVNGDLFADIVVGAPHYPGQEANEGGAFVFHGSASGMAVNPSWTAVSGQSGAGFGKAVSTAGDVNQDGFDDVIVGANFYNDDPDGGDASIEGAIFVYLGSALGTQSIGWMALGDKANTELGFSVGSAGDITGDGYSDVIAGAPKYRHSDREILGRAYVYFGNDGELFPYREYLPMVLAESP